MPLYDYKCREHGVFQELATFADYCKPCACPHCGVSASRVICLSPHLLDMAPHKRKAMALNERASHEPVISTNERRKEDHEHGNGCGCSAKKVNGSSLMYTARGEKMFPSMRPWMISH